MPGKRKHADAVIAEARRLSAEGTPLAEIARRVGVPYATLRYHLGKDGPALKAPPRPALRRRKADRSTRPMLIARLWSTAERQVAEIETRLSEAGGDPAGLERDAKTLSVLARTVRDLVALDAAAMDRKATLDADEIPKNIDDFRRALAEKLAELGKLERGDATAVEAGREPA